jgi:hypothetical protein
LRARDPYPQNTINDSIPTKFIPMPKLPAYARREEWERRRPELIKQIKGLVLRGLPSATVPFDTWKGADNRWASRYAETINVEFTTEQDVRVQGMLFVPHEAKYRRSAFIYAKRIEDLVYPIDWDPLLPVLSRQVVLTLHPRCVDYPIDLTRLTAIKRSVALLGGTLESMQLWDILRSIDFLTKDQNYDLQSISLYGRGQMGPLAVYAAALDDRISRVILEDSPDSHWEGPPMLNILRFTDLPEVASLLAPRELVSLTPLRRGFEYTASIYGLYGKKDSIRHAGGLGEGGKLFVTPVWPTKASQSVNSSNPQAVCLPCLR